MDSGNDHSWQETLFRNISFKEQEHGHEDVVSPMATRTGRRSSVHFDATSTIQRLRSSMVGLPQLYTAATVDDIVSDSSADSVPDASSNTKSSQQSQTNAIQWLLNVMGQIPAITLIAIFHLMIGIPFGVSYFPMSWSPYVEEANDEEGPFPLPGKEALGIRMFLFSTMIGQIVFTMTSKFSNPIGLQMVENVPFCHELAQIVIQHQGYGLDALSTLFVMFGLSSVLVGLVFYVLGKRNLGRVVYFFPTHVLIGCIGGIGVFLAKTGVEVTIANVFSVTNIIERWTVLWVAVAFEIVLRGLEKVLRDENGQPLYSLLSPIYFCMITPMFYFGLKIARLEISQADDMGFFFPPLDNESSAAAAGIGGSSVWYENHIWDMWTVIDIPTVSWAAIRDSLPTLLALSLFSLVRSINHCCQNRFS